MASESDKRELVLGVNCFDKPAEAIGVNAWAKLVTNLLFMKKGTYPSEPDMGIEIQKYEFSFIDDVKEELETEITEQVHTYLSSVPLSGINISSTTLESGKVVLLVVLEFSYNGNLDSAVVAAENSANLINFKVAM